MTQLYLTDSRASLGFSENQFVIKRKGEPNQCIPAEGVEGVSIFGNSQVSTQCLKACLTRGIDVQYYSMGGRYFGRLTSSRKANTARQRLQTGLTADISFALPLAKSILKAKIHNQVVLIRRYARSAALDPTVWVVPMQGMASELGRAMSLEAAMGYEGSAARIYFSALGSLVNVEEFKFSGRSKRPPRDPFNAMLSLGYSMLLDEVYGALENRGLNPYFGFIHSDRDGHPTLASDLMEEWRPVIVDSLVMSLVNGHETGFADFTLDAETGGVFLSREALRLFIKKLEAKLMDTSSYMTEEDGPVTFRRAINLQAKELCAAMEAGDPALYTPIRIR